MKEFEKKIYGRIDEKEEEKLIEKMEKELRKMNFLPPYSSFYELTLQKYTEMAYHYKNLTHEQREEINRELNKFRAITGKNLENLENEILEKDFYLEREKKNG